MLIKLLAGAAVSYALGFAALPQQTPPGMTSTYSSLADAILAVKQTEADLVQALVDGHLHAATNLAAAGEWDQVAAQIALVASEGDNAIGGVRKRLLEGGHHHNAAGEAKGIFEPGFVIVTRTVKEHSLATASALRKAGSDDERQRIWSEFEGFAKSALGRTR